MFRKIRASSNAVSSSRFPVGSSAIKRSGRPTMARAIPTSCRSLRDNVEAGASIRFSSPTQASNSGTFLAISRCAAPAMRNGRAILSATSNPRQPGRPERRSRCGAARPSAPPGRDGRIAAEQHQPAAVGRSASDMILSRVVLPAPTAPVSRQNAPGSSDHEMSERTGGWAPYRFPICSSLTTAVSVEAAVVRTPKAALCAGPIRCAPP